MKISRGCLIQPDNIVRAIGDDAAAFSHRQTTADSRLEIIYPNGTSKPIPPRSWDHFKND